jgi:hypothetical protein
MSCWRVADEPLRGPHASLPRVRRPRADREMAMNPCCRVAVQAAVAPQSGLGKRLRMAWHRSSRNIAVIAIALAAVPSPSPAETPVSRCVAAVHLQYAPSPAFKITCTSPADCEFEPAQPMNAAAMALIDVMAKSVIACWQDHGLTTVVPIPYPPSPKLSVQRYQASDARGSEVCNMSQLRPFGQDGLTTSFCAACQASKYEHHRARAHCRDALHNGAAAQGP